MGVAGVRGGLAWGLAAGLGIAERGRFVRVWLGWGCLIASWGLDSGLPRAVALWVRLGQGRSPCGCGWVRASRCVDSGGAAGSGLPSAVASRGCDWAGGVELGRLVWVRLGSGWPGVGTRGVRLGSGLPSAAASCGLSQGRSPSGCGWAEGAPACALGWCGPAWGRQAWSPRLGVAGVRRRPGVSTRRAAAGLGVAEPGRVTRRPVPGLVQLWSALRPPPSLLGRPGVRAWPRGGPPVRGGGVPRTRRVLRLGPLVARVARRPGWWRSRGAATRSQDVGA